MATSDYDTNLDGLTASIDNTGPSGATIDDFSYTYDSDSRVSTFGDTLDGTATYGYDTDGQLESASYTGAQAAESFSYDTAGNRTSVDGQSTTVGPFNQVTNDGTYSYQYDADGNETEQTTLATGAYTVYGYSVGNQLTSATLYTSAGVETEQILYTYDMFNNLIGREDTLYTDGAATSVTNERFIFDDPADNGQMVLQFETNSTAAPTAANLTDRYLWGPAVDQLLADEQVTNPDSPGNILWTIGDDQNTVRDVVNSDGELLDHIAYSAFGQQVSHTASNPAAVDAAFGYDGLFQDPTTGEDFAVNRVYNPASGTWNTPDPAQADVNTYRAFGNGPTNGTDPSGLFTLEKTWETYLERYGDDGMSLAAEAMSKGWTVEERPYWQHDWYAETDTKVIGLKSSNFGFERSDSNAADQLFEALSDLHNKPLQAADERKENDLLLGGDYGSRPGYVKAYRFFTAVALNSWVGSGIKHVDYAIEGATITNQRLSGWDRAKLGTIGSVETALTALPIGKGLTAGLARTGVAGVTSGAVRQAMATDLLNGMGEAALSRVASTRAGQAFLQAYGKVYASKYNVALFGEKAAVEEAAAVAPNSIAEELPAVKFSSETNPELAANIKNAQQAGHPEILTHGGDAAANRAAALEGVPNVSGLSRDEYPFASSMEGGSGAWVGHIPRAQQNSQGGILSNFFRQNNITPGDKYRVLVE